MRKALTFSTLLLAVPLVLATGAWGTLALWFQLPGGEWIRGFGAAAWALFGLAVLLSLFGKRPLRAGAAYGMALIALLVWWESIPATNVADWQAPVSRLVSGHLAGDVLTLQNVRNFGWTSETDFTERWDTRSYDLSRLRSADLIGDYWGIPGIAHMMLSFGFDDDRYLVWSIELRARKGQEWSMVGGFFKQAEIIYLAGEERDLIRLRTNIRSEDLRLFRLSAMDPRNARELLLEYVAEANDLVDHPTWYNTLTSNCTTMIFKMVRHISPGLPRSWKILLSGYFPEYAYAQGALDTAVPFAELWDKGAITPKAVAAGNDSEAAFSRAIRVGVPGIPQASP